MSEASLVVITGPMFSGKTDALIERFRLAGQGGGSVVAVKPERDDRHPPDRIVSHSGLEIPARSAGSVEAIEDLGREHATVLIDETQFFPGDLIDAVSRLVSHGVGVVAVGLDLDFRCDPFETTAGLIHAATLVEQMVAVCGRCGEPATLTQRLIDGVPAPLQSPQIVVGDRELYEPRCVHCWNEERTSTAMGV